MTNDELLRVMLAYYDPRLLSIGKFCKKCDAVVGLHPKVREQMPAFPVPHEQSCGKILCFPSLFSTCPNAQKEFFPRDSIIGFAVVSTDACSGADELAD